ncbi:MAG: phenylalanine--tRNA ligase subunit alpha [Candidatus Margulisiibacteriota bacterium]|nr:MAG: phenylalanine--tRNA ligase subunit alpha [Candidatus Margulisbacteria bacterium GWD2_39_127]OGI04415.1 MAG: phenylalanine--tRNA ligase subunit alpha [Candidatus Margulisbacteria bacterium GWF2_38_17]OGI07349.1 MAG: phenylalanine--tRNA ligase subunit alpha [Candidatus Margulisbacteria bacterium GWE2_39_32]PZM80081.1 MAG: phenylalanine--tRNA ligase subunit alpha [Candidatus Margulisiibacteriota bacterium]HAR62848.1 phenylalanine--tRNA ligase subunit alpha [Candidatus Margulisiibacteriota 
MQSKLDAIKTQAINEINQSKSSKDIEDIKVKYLGKKSDLSQTLKDVGTLTAQERPFVGKLVNLVKVAIEESIEKRYQDIAAQEQERQLISEKIDVTLPGKKIKRGTKHPLTQILEEIVDIFKSLGYSVAEGPEIETDFYNFEALNIPKDHPSREMHDTFYLESEYLLRTHTSPVQIHTMMNQKPPIKIIAPGRVYRRDADASHSPVFHQVEGLYVDHNVTFSDLKGTLEIFIKKMFGITKKVRLRPSYFPFTEPSAEVDVECVICNGNGCRLCKNTGWLEILGSGMVDPNVYDMVNYDKKQYTGFAFGMGLERIAMLKYGIDNIKLFYDNDVRFLKQF